MSCVSRSRVLLKTKVEPPRRVLQDGRPQHRGVRARADARRRLRADRGAPRHTLVWLGACGAAPGGRGSRAPAWRAQGPPWAAASRRRGAPARQPRRAWAGRRSAGCARRRGRRRGSGEERVGGLIGALGSSGCRARAHRRRIALAAAETFPPQRHSCGPRALGGRGAFDIVGDRLNCSPHLAQPQALLDVEGSQRQHGLGALAAVPISG